MSVARDAFSSSIVEENLLESELTKRFNLLDWKDRVEQNMLDLERRVLALEKNKMKGLSKKSSNVPSFSNAGDDGCAGLWTCASLIKIRKAAFLQCIWMIIFVVGLTILGITHFLKAKENMEAQFKPEKKYQTINYADEGTDVVYEIPYIYIYFFGAWSNSSDESNVNMNETLELLLKSQNYFENSAWITYFDDSFEEVYIVQPIEEVQAFAEEDYGRGFFGQFILKLEDPKPSIGSFQYEVEISMPALTLGQRIIVDGFWVSIARNEDSINWRDAIYVSTVNALNLSKISTRIDYNEKITRTWSNEKIDYFTTYLGDYSEIEQDNSDYKARSFDKTPNDGGLVIFQFRGTPIVEYWEEYVEYDYYDWLSGMGGILGMSSIFFFWGAYYIAVIFRKTGERFTMGILPEISFIFDNFESVHLLKKQVIEE